MANQQDPAPNKWIGTLRERLSLFGHRNWVGVVDSAYPLQTSPGVEMIDTRTDALEVIGVVLGAIEASPHIRAIAYLDAELAEVPETDAKGVTRYRDSLDPLLKNCSQRVQNHEEIIARLSQAGREFNILLLKTTLAIPYTSVFFELDCGYWSADAEDRLRRAIRSSSASSAAKDISK